MLDSFWLLMAAWAHQKSTQNNAVNAVHHKLELLLQKQAQEAENGEED